MEDRMEAIGGMFFGALAAFLLLAFAPADTPMWAFFAIPASASAGMTWLMHIISDTKE
jgi:hypothetical protein